MTTGDAIVRRAAAALSGGALKRIAGTAALLAVALLAASAPVAGGDFPGAARVRIELQADASASGAVVHLADVALVDGPGGDALKALTLCPAPLAGGQLDLSADRVRRRVMAALGSADFTFAGAASCRVKREAVAQPATVSGDDASGAPAGKLLAGIIRDYVAERLDVPGCRIEFEPRTDDVLGLDDGQWQFRLRSSTGRFSAGPAGVRVEVLDRANPRLVVRSASIRFTVIVVADVVVAARSFRTGHVIGDQDVRVERREFHDLPRMLITDPGDVIGATARGNVDAGQLMQVEDLKETLLVRRGNAVTVYVYGRAFRIKTVARALEGGELGSAVAVEGLDGRGKFYATVTGPRTVELRLAGSEPEGSAVASAEPVGGQGSNP